MLQCAKYVAVMFKTAHQVCNVYIFFTIRNLTNEHIQLCKRLKQVQKYIVMLSSKKIYCSPFSEFGITFSSILDAAMNNFWHNIFSKPRMVSNRDKGDQYCSLFCRNFARAFSAGLRLSQSKSCLKSYGMIYNPNVRGKQARFKAEVEEKEVLKLPQRERRLKDWQ